jgi:hypothetical protein
MVVSLVRNGFNILDLACYNITSMVLNNSNVLS